MLSRIFAATSVSLTLMPSALAATIAVAAIALPPTTARAGWTCSTLDGNGGTSGRTTRPVIDVGAALSRPSLVNVPYVFYTVAGGEPQPSHWLRAGRAIGSTLSFETLEGDVTLTGQTAQSVGYVQAAAMYNQSMYLFHTDQAGVHLRTTRMSTSDALSRMEIDGPSTGAVGSIRPKLSATEFDGKLYVFYAELNANNGRLFMAVYNGTSWSLQALDGFAGGNGRIVADMDKPAAIVVDGDLRVYYQDVTNGDLREGVSADGVNWTFSTIDGNGGGGGKVSASVGNGIAAVSSGGARVFYYDQTNTNLREAHLGFGAPTFSVVDGAGGANGQVNGDVGAHPTVVVHQNSPQVFYTDATNSAVRGAFLVSGQWNAATIDGAASGNLCAGSTSGNVGGAVAIEHDGNPIVYYQDVVDQTVRMAKFTP